MSNMSQMLRRENMIRYGFGPEVMKRTKVCIRCGQKGDADRQFCVGCGERLPDTTLYDFYRGIHSYCPICDTVVTQTTQFCPKCGTKIKKQEERKHGIF